MKLDALCRAANSRRSTLPRLGILAALVFSSSLAPALIRAQAPRRGLGGISGTSGIRYASARRESAGGSYVFLGDSLSLSAKYIGSELDLKRTVVEYDAAKGIVYRYYVPGEYGFTRKQELRDSYYHGQPRDLSLPGLTVEIETFDDEIGKALAETRERVRLEDVKYNLTKERVEKVGKGLLSLDIPIALPRTLERIIGRGQETNLTVQGSERVKVSGTSNWCTGCPLTEGRPRQEKFPDLDLEQQLNVNLHGNVGEKINVEVQHSSSGGGVQSTNRVRLNYKGFDDDVIKLIEMGDTDLILSGAQLVSYSGSAKGLFGVKAMAQTGPLDLTVIASKQEGETARGSFSAGGGQAGKWQVADVDFISRQFFYFENPGPSFAPGSVFESFDTTCAAVGMEVFVSLTEQEKDDPTKAGIPMTVYPDSLNNGLEDDIADYAATGRKGYEASFRQLDLHEDYELMQDYNAQDSTRYVGIYLSSPIENYRALAVRYRMIGKVAGATIGIIGDLGDRDAFKNHTAELICPLDEKFDPKSATWNMMMRNVYSLGSNQIDPQTLDVKIVDLSNNANNDIHPESKISYLRLFGLDRYDKAGNRIKDDRIDDVPGILDINRGYLMFPWPEPFNPPPSLYEPNPGFVPYINSADTLESKFQYATLARDSALYNTVLTQTAKQNNHRYDILVEGSSSQRTFQLQAFDIIEGSEVVTVDGQRLARGVDYDIDYASGIVTLKGDVLKTPESKVLIDYQQKPLIGGGKNSLLGIGANLNLSPNFRISSTFLYNAMGAPKYAPRLGEEPSRTMAADINGNFVFYPKIMTTLANLLPRVDTNAPSNLTVSAEVAVSIPNPNTKGEAIVDDMEGVEENSVVSMLRRSWYESSPALTPLAAVFDSATEFYWYNPAQTDKQQYLISSKWDLNPRLDERENSNITSLFIDPIIDTRKARIGEWCGVMTGFPGSGLDLSTAQYLELWVNDYNPDTIGTGLMDFTPQGGTVHVDFGWIDEDFHDPSGNKFDDERTTEFPWTIDEDTGFPGDVWGDYPSNISNCCWNEDKFVYDGIDSRKGNALHDTEDLNGNQQLDEENNYYTLSFNLASSAIIDVQRDFRNVDDPNAKEYWEKETINKSKAWRLYRLELSKAEIVGSAPRIDNIQHMRIWIENPDSVSNFDTRHLLEVAEVQFVGNRWESNGIRDAFGKLITRGSKLYLEEQKLVVGTINNKEDPGYRSPYSVQQEEGITNREQSLRLKFEQFQDSTAFSTVKRFFGQGQNYGQYRDIQFFVYPNYEITSTTGIDFYLQIAYDSLNYYEIEVPLRAEGARDDSKKWILVNVSLADLTNLKFIEGDTIISREIRDAVDGSRVYRAKRLGNPTLFQVRYLYAGLRNLSGTRLNEGEVWFDDLRLGGVRRDVDSAERLSVSADFAGILQVSGGWQRTGPEFRSLQQMNGSGYTNSSLSLSGKTELGRFIPTLGFAVPLSGRYNTSSSLPKYMPQSDIEIASAEKREDLKSVNNDYAFNVSLSRKGSTNFVMRNLFDNLMLGYSYSRRQVYTPNSRDTTTGQTGSLKYELRFPRKMQLGLFKGIKWRYWLSSFTFESGISERVRQYYQLTGTELVKRPATRDGSWDNSFVTLYEPFESVKFNFDVREQRALTANKFVQQTFSHNLRFNYQPTGQIFILSALNPRFDFTSRYAEDLRPTIRQGRDPWGTRNVSNQRDMNFVFDLDIGKYAMELGERAKIVKTGEGSPRRSRFAEVPSTLTQRRDEFLRSHEQQQQQQAQGAGDVIATEEEGVAPPDTTQPPLPQQPRPELQGLGSGRPGGPGASAEKAAPADTTRGTGAAAKADTTAGKRYNPLSSLKPIVLFLGKLEPLKTNIRMSHQTSYQRLYDRASIFYQLALSDGAGVPGKLGGNQNDPERVSDNLVIDSQTGLGLTANIDMTVKANFGIRSEDQSGGVTKYRTSSWPVLDVNWRGLEKNRLFSKYLQTSELRIHFDRRKARDPRGEETAYTVSPNWNLEFKRKNPISATVGVSYARKSRLENRQDQWDQSWGVTTNLRYNISGSKGFGIPLPLLSKKKLSFKSTLTTNLDVSYTNSTRYNVRRPSTSLSVSPHASYQFSNNVTGALGLSYRRNAGGELGTVNQSIGVDLTAEFRF